MPRLTRMDEYFVHQLPEPLPITAIAHQHWRESYFFVAHPNDASGDVLIVAMAHYPAREVMDALVMGRVAGQRLFAVHQRPYEGDPHTTVVGPVAVTIDEPFEAMTVRVDEPGGIQLDMRFAARTAPHGLRRGTLRDHDGLIWDQSHMIQSGHYSGSYEALGTKGTLDGWWGQRDHSWGVREHGRCPMWMWLAIQLDDGMLGVWHWELTNGARIYTDGCFAPIDDEEPVPVVDFHHDLTWTDEAGQPVGYGAQGDAVKGLSGHVEFHLADGRTIGVTASGQWCCPYQPFVGGGQHLMAVETDDGRTGTAIYEVTGVHHHRYFPERVVSPMRG